MAFFKFRKGGDEQPTPPTASESLEAMRRRARHRLVGAAVLVAIGVVGFPLLFDSQPRPIAVDIPIDIPDKGKVRPLGAPALPPATQASGVVIEEREEPTPKVALSETKASAIKPEAKPEPKAEPKVEPKPAVKPVDKPSDKPADKPVAKVPEKAPENAADKTADKAASQAAEAAKAQALLDGKAPAKPADKSADKKAAAADTGRFVVQVGAYNEPAKLQEARSKVEKAGFKTYTQVVGAKDSQRTRVRIGPFATKADAQKAADKIKKLSLPAAILEL
ncbi:SPOR domain-containing protein [Rhodoferax sp.]|uniref:SPOR domain-containing protein n=1 Tax=Rhodoferax sp. TaxID=50421 RepID=UPI0025CF147C|nr:SPOR domain-containing protein [Rhodoferax sp.]